MKLKLIPALRVACCLMFFSGLNFTAMAQFTSMASKAPWLQSFFAKMNPNTPEFSATGNLDMCDPSGTIRMELPMDVAATTNAFRWEVDASKFWPMPPEVKAMAKQMHTDKTVFLVKTDEQNVYMIYPDLQAYLQFPIPASALAEFDASSKSVQFQKTPLGREFVDGHPCIRNKVTDVEPNSPPEQGLMWNATDLQGFPIKMDLDTGRGLMKFNFQNVVVQSPNPSLFEIPVNYKLFRNSAELMEYAKSQVSAQNTN